MAKNLRVGVIGAGSIAKLGHIPGLRKVPGVDVVALCDKAGDRAKAVAEELKVPKVYTDYNEMLAAEKLDAVTIGTPNALHAPMALAALNAGAHVFCEKPLCVSVEDGERMVAAAKKAGKILALNMQMRTSGEVRVTREAVAKGDLGEVRYAQARWLRSSGIPGFGSWFTRRELSGGGVLMDIGVHMLDQLMFILDFPKVTGVRGEMQSIHGVKGRGLGGWGVERHEKGIFDVEDFAAVHLRLDGGGLITVEVSWAVFGQDEMRFTLFGTEGGADSCSALYGEKTPLRFFRDSDGKAVEVTPKLPSGAAGWDRTTADFVESIRENRVPLCPGGQGLQVLRILDAAYRSAREGRETALA